jgi:hypothetical protein
LENILLPYRIIMDFAKGIRTMVPSELAPLVFRVAKEGKLLSLFCDHMDVFIGYTKQYLEKRCLLTKLYNEYLGIVGEKLNASGVEYYVFKTLKPFAYDMTDLDLLFTNMKDMLSASKILIEKYGFKLIARGTYSISLRRTIGGLDVDLDLQTKIAAGTFEYIEISNIKDIIGEIGYINKGLSLLKPELELIVITGHAFYKDFLISLANTLYYKYLQEIIDGDTLKTIFEYYPHLFKPFKTLNYLVNSLRDIIYIDKYSIDKDSHRSLEYLLVIRSVHGALRKGRGILPLPVTIIVSNYVKTAKVLVKNRKFHQLRELSNLPRSRGVGLLFRRIGVLPPEETIRM